MTGIAFYAPMKPASHPVPSGDREMARALMAALDGLWGQPLVTVSELRLYEGQGDAAAQVRLRAEAEAEVARLVTRGRAEGWTLWASYHNYYKAPDLIGPAVAGALGIPYVVFEASLADKRLDGPWAGFEQAAREAVAAADVIFCLTERDREALERHAAPGQLLVTLPPFLNREGLGDAACPGAGRLVTVAMMRAGDKLQSYRHLAEALGHVEGRWTLDVIGGGAAEAEVHALFAPWGDRVRFRGVLTPAEIAAVFAQSAVFVWPGVNEAFGMVYLEAMAAGVPVVAEDRPGLREIVPAAGLAAAGDPVALATRIDGWLGDGTRQAEAAQAARRVIAERHLLPAARAGIAAALALATGRGGT